MRNSFALCVKDLADRDSNIRLLVGDIGFRIFDSFLEFHSEKFINCGIAEQNMISVAAGMASEGLKVFVYTITPFLIMRAYEQIRVDLGINASNVVLVGVGAGLAYDKLGPTHHSYEDIALMRCIPNLNILTPYDGPSTRDCILKAYKDLGSASSYVRLSKGGEKSLSSPSESTTYYDLWNTKQSTSTCVVCHGSIASRYVDSIKQNKLNYNVLVIKEISNLAVYTLADRLKTYGQAKVIFCEEAFSIGSLFESFSVYNRDKNSNLLVGQVCLPNIYIYDVLDRESLLDYYFFRPEDLLKVTCS